VIYQHLYKAIFSLHVYKKKKSDDFKSHFSHIHSNWGGHNDLKGASITHIIIIVCTMQYIAWDRIYNHLRRVCVCACVCVCVRARTGFEGRISRKRL